MRLTFLYEMEEYKEIQIYTNVYIFYCLSSKYSNIYQLNYNTLNLYHVLYVI